MTIGAGVLAVVGRNGMGKSTLCNTVTGLKASRSGSIRIFGRETSRLEPHVIHRHGVGYVPQGRRVWPSLSVDEHLRLVATGGADAKWTVEGVYQTFPRLYERRASGGSQLSGGEQQMLAIGRALLGNPRLLVMDEPTEGLAPIIVDQVEAMLVQLAKDGDMAVLLIEQNIGVATAVSDHVAIMVNGRINRVMETGALAADRELQQRLLGVGKQDEEEGPLPEETAAGASAEELMAQVYRVERGEAAAAAAPSATLRPSAPLSERWNMPATSLRQSIVEASRPEPEGARIFSIPFAERIGRTAIVAGTFDTKGRELNFIRDRLKATRHSDAHGRSLHLAQALDRRRDAAPCRKHASARQLRSFLRRSRPLGDGDGRGVRALDRARARIGGIISAGGSGGTTLATAGMRALPVGIPKVMVSTVAAGDVRAYVGASDVVMFHSVADIQGLNSITERVLANAAHALAGMIAQMPTREAYEARRKIARPALGVTMFGVTTPCVQAVTRRLEADYDCLVFHATGTGGRAMEALGDSGLLAGFLDLTTTEVADMLVGGILPADQDRLGALRSAPVSLTSARPARSTWLISARATPCRRSSKGENLSSTMPT